MPNYTIDTSAANATRIIAALDRRYRREPGETDRQLFARDLITYYKELVLWDERQKAQDVVVPDDSIVGVT